MTKNPRVLALRFRIWQFAEPRGWNVTTSEIAEGLGDLTSRHVGLILRAAGWSGRISSKSMPGPSEYNTLLASGSRRLANALYHEMVAERSGRTDRGALQ